VKGRRCRLHSRVRGDDLLYGACIGSLLGTTYLGFVAVHHGLVCEFGTAKHRRVLPRQQGAAQARPSYLYRPCLLHVPVRLVPGMLRATVKTRDRGCRVGPVSVVDLTANRSVLITRPAVVHAVPARHACGAALSRANELCGRDAIDDTIEYDAAPPFPRRWAVAAHSAVQAVRKPCRTLLELRCAIAGRSWRTSALRNRSTGAHRRRGRFTTTVIESFPMRPMLRVVQ
jgi:hypothetical protein